MFCQAEERLDSRLGIYPHRLHPDFSPFFGGEHQDPEERFRIHRVAPIAKVYLCVKLACAFHEFSRGAGVEPLFIEDGKERFSSSRGHERE